MQKPQQDHEQSSKEGLTQEEKDFEQKVEKLWKQDLEKLREQDPRAQGDLSCYNLDEMAARGRQNQLDQAGAANANGSPVRPPTRSTWRTRLHSWCVIQILLLLLFLTSCISAYRPLVWQQSLIASVSKLGPPRGVMLYQWDPKASDRNGADFK